MKRLDKHSLMSTRTSKYDAFILSKFKQASLTKTRLYCVRKILKLSMIL